MPDTSPKVDAYIAKAPEYARPILDKLRSLFHEAGPELTETTKWGVPYYECKGLVGGMAAFKNHVTIAFWKAKIMEDPEGILGEEGGSSMSAAKFRSLDDLPRDEVLIDYIREAIRLNEEGVALPRPPVQGRAEPEVPDDLAAALAKHPEARATFEGFAPGYRREYVEWITEAKRDETRTRRIAQAVEWLAEGKTRNWKYR